MQSDCKNTSVFQDSRFVMLLAFAHPPITRRLQKSLPNLSLKSPKTIPKGASTSVASWKYFRDGFGTILDSQMGSSSRALRRPRRFQKRHLFTLASLDASRNDFGAYLDLLGLDFRHFLDTLSAAQLRPMSPKTGCALHFSRHCFPDGSTVAEVAKH